MKDKSLTFRIFALAKPEWKVLAVATIFLAIGSGANLVFPQMVRQILDQALTVRDMDKVNHAVLIIWIAFMVQGIASSLRYYLFTVTGERIVLNLRAQLYSHILNQEVAFFDFQRTGDLMSRLSSDATILQNTVSVNISMGLRNIAGAVGGLALMIYTAPKLAFAILLVMPPVGLSAAYFGKRIRAASKRTQEALAEAANISEETISGLRTVRSFSQEDYEKNRYNLSLGKSLKEAVDRIWQISWFMTIASLMAFSAVSAVLWYGGQQVVAGVLSVGDLTQFLIYLLIVAFSVGALGNLWGDLMAAAGAAKRVFDILDKVPEVNLKSGKRLESVRGEIEFKNVSFAYPARTNSAVLKSLDFSLKPGMVMALVGQSGSGKSSTASLVARFYDPTEGQIVLDGHPLTELEPSWLREQIGVVAQEPVLISSTIEENIRYGNQNATKEQIQQAAREANAENFILQFPDQYQTLVGERGVQLSGGQKQRVAIARAILKDPRILILDEATSALDTESEALVQEALQRLMRGRTTLIIAHRLATIREANLILVLDKGKIVETGRHQDLMQIESGIYRKLIERQVVT